MPKAAHRSYAIRTAPRGQRSNWSRCSLPRRFQGKEIPRRRDAHRSRATFARFRQLISEIVPELNCIVLRSEDRLIGLQGLRMIIPLNQSAAHDTLPMSDYPEELPVHADQDRQPVTNQRIQSARLSTENHKKIAGTASRKPRWKDNLPRRLSFRRFNRTSEAN